MSSQKSLFEFGITGRNKRAHDESDNADASASESTVSPAKKPKEAASSSIGSSIHPKTWQNKWLEEFSWLRKDKEGLMFCLVCEKSPGSNKNVFVTGCKNYQHSTLMRHQATNDHIKAKNTAKQQVYMETAKKIVTQKCMPVLEAQLRTAMFIAEQNLPNRKFLKLIDLQLANGASVFSDKKGIYTGCETAAKFQKCIADVLREAMYVRIKNSPFIGLMFDESLVIATNKKLVLFCKIIHDGCVKIEFCQNISIIDGKAETVYNAIVNFLQEIGVNMAKVSGLGSDGASVMMGRISGVGVRVKNDTPRVVHVWCAAHRIALVAYWAAKQIPYFKSVNETLINVFMFYQYSAPRMIKLRELQKIMGKKVKRFKKPTQVRWLSLSEAVSAFHDSFSALVLSLEHEHASMPNSEGGNKALGILKRIKKFKFIVVLSFLKDVLAELDRISKLFQADDLDIQTLKDTIQATKDTIRSFKDDDPLTAAAAIESIEEMSEYQGITVTVNLLHRRQYSFLRNKFVDKLIEEFDSRFPQGDLSILNDLNTILNPKLLSQARAIGEYGLESLERCIQYYGNAPDQLVQANDLRNSFLQFKYLMNVNRELTLRQFCLKILSDYRAAYPGFATLAEILCTCPLTSVPCERGFSLQNRHHTASTCRRSIQNVEDRMVIEYESKKGAIPEEVIRSSALRFKP